MRRLARVFSIVVAVLFCAVAQAEIYETRDAKGNPVFSDTPTEGAKEVELQQKNIADAPQPIPALEPEDKTLPAEPSVPAAGSERTVVVGGDDDLLDNRYEVLDAEARHEVRDAEARHEVSDAEPRHEVSDGETQHEVENVAPQGEIRHLKRRHHIR